MFSGVGSDTPDGEESGADTATLQVPDESRAGRPVMPLPAPKAADLRNDAAEEDRRHKLRQVCPCRQCMTLPGRQHFLTHCFCRFHLALHSLQAFRGSTCAVQLYPNKELVYSLHATLTPRVDRLDIISTFCQYSCFL